MADDKTPDSPNAQVYRLVKSGQGSVSVRKLTAAGFVDDSKGAPANAVASNAAYPEDEYQMYYIGGTNDRGVLEPPFNLRLLDRLSQENNTLSPCIEAMVTNVDGTGYDFSSKDEGAEDGEDDAKIDQLREFFSEPIPGSNFISLRKKLRRDLESTGNAYLEVLRNAQDEVVFLKHVDAKMMRLIKLDDPVDVAVTVKRNGVDTKITMMKRERRFVQLLNGLTLVYFKEFGASRDVDKATGLWAEKGKRLSAKVRGTEILHFTCLPDAHTDYGVPRWISQLPSVLGSRKAEEFNMDFFDHGGIPPVLITLQGGTLQDETRKALENKMTGSAEKTNRVQILEVEPSGGSLDHPTQARVTVERFGGDRTNDSMFEMYDEKCTQRIRRAFRLAPIFLGAADDYSFASAYVSYTVTEAQVFKPERDEFDEIINSKLLPSMGFTEHKMVSKPLVIEDVNLKIEGLQIALGTNRVDVEDVIYELNEATGLSLKTVEPPPEPSVPNGLEGTHTVDNSGKIIPIKPVEIEAEGNSTPTPAPKRKWEKQPAGIHALAKDTLIALRKRDFESLGRNLSLIKSLDRRGMAVFKQATAELQFVNPDYDADGLGDLASATIALMHHANCDHQH